MVGILVWFLILKSFQFSLLSVTLVIGFVMCSLYYVEVMLPLCAVLSRSVMSESLRPHGLCSPPGSSVHGDSSGKNTGASCHTLLQGIFPTQGLNIGLPHCRWILYYLSHQGSPCFLFVHLIEFLS